ncbi:YetF domain-containing protein [Streptomyces sp. NPDC001857]|uniref:YetF domain-containing protein n=1 Tax=unclassified Streptomyces TaxID=2593676 RepID=UPI00332C2E1B
MPDFSGVFTLQTPVLELIIRGAVVFLVLRDSHSMTDGIVVATILVCSVAVDAYRFPHFAAVFKARPKKLIKDGRPDRTVMRRALMTNQELLSQLRLHGGHDPARVHLACLEPTGSSAY